jgi:hypothetical protein
LKFKIAHKRADSEKWSATEKTQRKRMIKFLQDVISDLEGQQDAAAEAQPVAAKPVKKAAAKKRGVTTPKSMARPTRRRRKTAA